MVDKQRSIIIPRNGDCGIHWWVTSYSLSSKGIHTIHVSPIVRNKRIITNELPCVTGKNRYDEIGKIFSLLRSGRNTICTEVECLLVQRDSYSRKLRRRLLNCRDELLLLRWLARAWQSYEFRDCIPRH